MIYGWQMQFKSALYSIFEIRNGWYILIWCIALNYIISILFIINNVILCTTVPLTLTNIVFKEYILGKISRGRLRTFHLQIVMTNTNCKIDQWLKKTARN